MNNTSLLCPEKYRYGEVEKGGFDSATFSLSVSQWDRTGGFDETYMHEFLKRLDKADPGHMRSARPNIQKIKVVSVGELP